MPSGLSSVASPSVEAKTKGGDYRLYLLPDNSSASLTEVKSKVNGGNAVLLYPDPEDKGRLESRKYKACFIQNGDLRVHPASKKLEEMSMGNRAIRVTATPCDITTIQPNAVNLIKTALARADIRVEAALFKIPNDVMCEKVFASLPSLSLAAFARSSFYSHKLVQPELDQRAVGKLFTYILNGNLIEAKKMLDINPRLSLVR